MLCDSGSRCNYAVGGHSCASEGESSDWHYIHKFTLSPTPTETPIPEVVTSTCIGYEEGRVYSVCVHNI